MILNVKNNMLVTVILGLFAFAKACQAQQPTALENLIKTERLQYLTTNNPNASIEHVIEKDTMVHIFSTMEQPKFIYKMGTALPLKKENIAKGRIVLLSFDAMTRKSSEETGEAKLMIQLRQGATFKENQDRVLNLGSSWKRYHIPFETEMKVAKENLGIVFQYGFEPQSFAVKNLSLVVYPDGTRLDDVPRTATTYIGMEPDAEWRAAAQKRIEKLRMSDFKVTFDSNRKHKNGEVKIELVRHYFPFGVAAHAEQILNDDDLYKRIKENFGLVVLANDLKIKAWSNKNKREQALKAIDKLRADNINVKGHVLIWPGYQYTTSGAKKAAKEGAEALETFMENHVRSILKLTEGKITHWDVTNETYTNQDFQKVTGNEEILYEGFRILRKQQPHVGRFTNEYGIISKDGIDHKKIEWYRDYIKRVDENTDGGVTGIGIQSHIGTDLTPPERVLEILNYYAALGKPISISEFTMDVKDPEVREKYTRDFITAAFSHPNVSEFLFWGFQEDGRKKVDIYEKDGGIGEMGKAFFSLVNDQWKTQVKGKVADLDGKSFNGFQGLYKYEVMVEGETKTGYFEVLPRQENDIEIKL